MEHKKEGILVLRVRQGDEIKIGEARVMVKELGFANRLAIQAPKDLKIETIQPWRKRGGV